MSLSPNYILPSIHYRRRSLSPNREQNFELKDFYSKKIKQTIYHGKESSVKLPFIQNSCRNPEKSTFLSQTPVKHYNWTHKLSKIQRENCALRDFITNFHLQKEGNRVVSSLDALTNGTTFEISGKIQKYFSQLEDYIHKL